LLPYEAIRSSSNPNIRLLEFFEDTYRAAAELGKWDRSALERSTGEKRTMKQSCVHLEHAAHRAKHVTPTSHGCEECLKIGADWVHLRLCLTCGHVGCCDSSPYGHATAHFHGTSHPVIRSYEPGESWGWCYPDKVYAETLAAFEGEVAHEHYSPP
jgi:hypothetical protein